MQHAVSTLPRVRVMGHHQHGSAGVSIFPQGVQHGNGIIGIQIARGLVRQDQLGPVEQRSSQGDTLPLSDALFGRDVAPAIFEVLATS